MRGLLPAVEERRTTLAGDLPRRQAQHRGDGSGRAAETAADRGPGPHHQNLGPVIDLDGLIWGRVGVRGNRFHKPKSGDFCAFILFLFLSVLFLETFFWWFRRYRPKIAVSLYYLHEVKENEDAHVLVRWDFFEYVIL